MAATAAAAGTLDYVVAFDVELATATVRICPRGIVPARLVPGIAGARALLARAAIERESGLIALTPDIHGVPLSGLRAGECARLVLSLRDNVFGFGAPVLRRQGDSLLLNTATLLWRPPDHARYASKRVRFDVPQPHALSVPFGERDREGRFVLDESALAFHAYAAVGALSLRRLHVAGSTLELAMLQGFSHAQQAAIERWVLAQVGAVAQLAGGLPRERIQLVVLPAGVAREPVRFGSLNRGGGASVLALMASDFDERALLTDWVLVHELSHLLHPFVVRREAWLSEGIATYYQEVLRARAGLHTAQDAWHRILAGSEQAKDLPGSLEQGAARMYETFQFAPVYWAGASVMLRADIELRRRSDGACSLDDVMLELARCCAQSARPLRASEVVAHFDRIAGAPVLATLVRDVVGAPRVPDLTPWAKRLGLDPHGAWLPSAPAAELAAIARAIMAPRVQTQPVPRRGAACLQPDPAGGTRPP